MQGDINYIFANIVPTNDILNRDEAIAYFWFELNRYYKDHTLTIE